MIKEVLKQLHARFEQEEHEEYVRILIDAYEDASDDAISDGMPRRLMSNAPKRPSGLRSDWTWTASGCGASSRRGASVRR